MTHITPKDPDSIPELAPVLKMVEAAMGFVPTSMLTMAHWPELMTSFSAFAGPVLNSGSIDPGLKQLIAFVVSNAAGCRYCQAHTSHSAQSRGVSPEKIQAFLVLKKVHCFRKLRKQPLMSPCMLAWCPMQWKPRIWKSCLSFIQNVTLWKLSP